MASSDDKVVVIPDSGTPAQTAEKLSSINNRMLRALPAYTSVANAQSAGLVSGDFFVLTGVVVGILALQLVVRIP